MPMIVRERIADPDMRRAVALRACACPDGPGISMHCPATKLPAMGDKLLVRGETCPIPFALPLRFECPRYAVMGW